MKSSSSILSILSRAFTTKILFIGIVAIIGQSGFYGDVRNTVAPRSFLTQSHAASAHQSGDLYAVVVGISKYRDPKIPPLKVSDKDAKSIAEFLRTQKNLFKEINVSLLVNEKATREALETELYYKIRRAGKDDTVIIFLSGHGSDDPKNPGEFFFLPYDANSEFMAVGGIHMNRQWFIDKLDSKRVLIIADACHAGGFTGSGLKRLPPFLDKFMGQFKQSEGRVFITSSRADELSREAPEHGHSLFTYYLLEGLSGKAADQAGIVYLKSLYDYVYRMTKKASDGFQSPQMEGKVVGLFPIAWTSSTSESIQNPVVNTVDPGAIHHRPDLEQSPHTKQETGNSVSTNSGADRASEMPVRKENTFNDNDKVGRLDKEPGQLFERVQPKAPGQQSNGRTESSGYAPGIQPSDKVHSGNEPQPETVIDNGKKNRIERPSRKSEVKNEQPISRTKESQKPQKENLSDAGEANERLSTREERTNAMEEQFKNAPGNWYYEQLRKTPGHNMDIWNMQRSLNIDAAERRKKMSE